MQSVVSGKGSTGLGAQSDPAGQSTCASAIDEMQARVVVDHVTGGSVVVGMGAQLPPSGWEPVTVISVVPRRLEHWAAALMPPVHWLLGSTTLVQWAADMHPLSPALLT